MTSHPRPGGSSGSAHPWVSGVRVDTHVEDGTVVPPDYDSLLAKVIVWGDDRATAVARGVRALSELVVEGIPTTQSFALEVLDSEAFTSGNYSTSFLDDRVRSTV